MEDHYDLVNEKDEVIGKTTRKEAHEKGLLHRVVHVVVQNSEGKILCLKRSKNVDTRPGSMSNCAEHVELGETYGDAAIRAPKEELGIDAKPEFVGKTIVKDGLHYTVMAVYKTQSEGPFKLDENELENAEFKTLEEIKKEIEEGKKYSPSFQQALKEIE